MMKYYCLLQGFLVESKLNKLLAPLEKDERSLMKLDAIFSVSADLFLSCLPQGYRDLVFHPLHLWVHLSTWQQP